METSESFMAYHGTVNAVDPITIDYGGSIFFIAGLKPDLVIILKENPLESAFVRLRKTDEAIVAALKFHRWRKYDNITIEKARLHGVTGYADGKGIGIVQVRAPNIIVCKANGIAHIVKICGETR